MTTQPDGPTDNEGNTPTEPAPEPPEDASEDRDSGNREAARRRRELRDEQAAHEQTRAQRDQLRQQLDARDTADVERQLASRLEDPADFWREASLADVRGEDGRIDDARLDAAVTELLRTHRHWAKGGAPRRDPDQGRGVPEKPSATQGWPSVFNPAG